MHRVLRVIASSGYGVMRGFRNAAYAVLALSSSVFAEPVTIVALGDSLTAGYGLADPADGLAPQLQAWLIARGADVVVENAGVSGDTTAGGLARVAWALTPETDAMIVALGGNDLLRGLDPAGSRTNLDGILREAQARNLPVLLVPLAAPVNFGPEYKTAFDAMYVDLAAEHDAILADDFFDGLRAAGADPADPASMAAFMQADGIHPNAQGVTMIVEGLGPKVEELLARVED